VAFEANALTFAMLAARVSRYASAVWGARSVLSGGTQPFATASRQTSAASTPACVSPSRIEP